MCLFFVRDSSFPKCDFVHDVGWLCARVGVFETLLFAFCLVSGGHLWHHMLRCLALLLARLSGPWRYLSVGLLIVLLCKSQTLHYFVVHVALLPSCVEVSGLTFRTVSDLGGPNCSHHF